ncbi:Enoyl-CoA hydratase domain-containing protein 3, mitochondrial [Hondaea fermentalgiana]|uniref:Enoyl-CoA hydratase domain-containing protein 3, mitochondrial n=1 Tax=Hondaea fermentalgiana TaxID=2315210 RepID=A0A2R5GCP3_9STRA|nr:Enoyl-CoA hydratase domain-containing protein 3, mitochondrial [Hondaea fermentalgiana]|eukprot:GBG25544.1 Enoyl-CoA hydratase domain-containing protein 3, mitochondrial [Hondaea fermentalgiana]
MACRGMACAGMAASRGGLLTRVAARGLTTAGGSRENGPALLSDRRDAVAVLTLNRPKQRNALSFDLLRRLEAELTAVQDDESVRCVLIQANGPAFCAGHDLREMTSEGFNTPEKHRELFTLCSRVMQLVEEIPQPVVAATHGIATAAGCQLAAAADVTVATASCRFATPGVSIGLFCSTPAVPLVRAIGRKNAMDMLLTGRLVPANEARLMGLVSRTIEPPQQHTGIIEDTTQHLQAEAFEIARQIAGRSGRALRIGKKTLRAQMDLDLKDAYEVANEAMIENMKTEDAVSKCQS